MWESRKRLRTVGAPLRVLVVDDDDIQLRALQRALRDDRSIELLVASNAIDGLLIIGNALPDLVVMDVYMPGLDGVETCRRIKSDPSTKAVPVIMVTTRGETEKIDQAKAAGCDGYLTKPIKRPELMSEVRRLIGTGPGK